MREEVEKLVEGRATDLLVAKYTMGIINHSPDERSETSERWFWVSPEGIPEMGEPYEVPFGNQFSHSYCFFKPSTSIEHAFVALETKYSYEISKNHDGSYRVGTWVNQHAGAMFATDKSLPMAICKSLLLWDWQD